MNEVAPVDAASPKKEDTMRRAFLTLLALGLLIAASPGVAVAGVEPSPFAPGQAKDLWTPPGQWEAFNPQPEPPAFSVKAQVTAIGVSTQSPGLARDLWTPPGQWEAFNPQPEPPAFSPVAQMRDIQP
jgi:hypothetical protein